MTRIRQSPGSATGAPSEYKATHSVAQRAGWSAIVDAAATIVTSYDTSVTLRQLFYRLVSAQVIPNTTAAYKTLSSKTAEARRSRTFPDLIDRGRTIHRRLHFDDPGDAVSTLLGWYRLERTAGQDTSLYLGVEKAGMVVQLQSWFDRYGLPILALGGYSSQTYVADVVRDAHTQKRRAVLLYAGDFDPSGEDIDRDFIERTGAFAKVVRIALTAEQVDNYRLPVNPGKTTDSRAAGFVARHGELVQVELDALDPATLRDLCERAIGDYWDTSAYQNVLDRERQDREQLRRLATDRL